MGSKNSVAHTAGTRQLPARETKIKDDKNFTCTIEPSSFCRTNSSETLSTCAHDMAAGCDWNGRKMYSIFSTEIRPTHILNSSRWAVRLPSSASARPSFSSVIVTPAVATMSLPTISSSLASQPPPHPSQQQPHQPQQLHDTIPPPQPQFAEPPLLTKLSPHIAVLLAQLIETRPADPLQFCADFFSARARAELATAAAAAATSASTAIATAATGSASSSSSAVTTAQNATAASASTAAAAASAALQSGSSTGAPASLPTPSSVYARRNKDAILDAFVTQFFESNPISGMCKSGHAYGLDLENSCIGGGVIIYESIFDALPPLVHSLLSHPHTHRSVDGRDWTQRF